MTCLGNTHGSNCYFSCDDGYEIDSDVNFITCIDVESTGQWNKDIPKCVEGSFALRLLVELMVSPSRNLYCLSQQRKLINFLRGILFMLGSLTKSTWYLKIVWNGRMLLRSVKVSGFLFYTAFVYIKQKFTGIFGTLAMPKSFAIHEWLVHKISIVIAELLPALGNLFKCVCVL